MEKTGIKLGLCSEETVFSGVRQHKANSSDCGCPHCHVERVLHTSLHNSALIRNAYTGATVSVLQITKYSQIAVLRQAHHMNSLSFSSITGSWFYLADCSSQRDEEDMSEMDEQHQMNYMSLSYTNQIKVMCYKDCSHIP